MAREKWEVEWTTDVPIIDGDSDPDGGTDHVQDFRTEAEAIAFARTKIEEDYWGSPRVNLRRAVVRDFGDGGPRVREWEFVRTVDLD